MSQRPPDSVPSPSRVTSETTDDPASVDLDEVLRPHATRRRRAVQAGSVVALLLVVVWALLRGVVPSLPGSASTTPSGGAPIPPTVVIAANISFGVVTLNGKQLAGSLPVVTTTAFRMGANVVTLSAPPFQPHTCTISVSGPGPTIGQAWVGGGVGCSFGTGVTYYVHGADLTPDFAVVISLDSTDLPSDQAAQAYATTTQAIAAVPPPTIIPSGQYYAVGLDAQGHLIARQAATPLQADVLVGAPDPQEQTGACSAQRLCATYPGYLAELAGETAPAGRRAWEVAVGLTLSWRYTSPAGAVTRSPQLPFSTTIQLVLTQDPSTGAWSVFVPPSAPVGGSGGTGASLPTLGDQFAYGLCDIGAQLVGVQGQNTYGTGVSLNQGVAGCEIHALAASSSATVLGTFLWRFGVLLAVDN
ncbi:MAG TPA: hypothetical protein VGK33_14840, partial [Chloroflexota bacterium]